MRISLRGWRDGNVSTLYKTMRGCLRTNDLLHCVIANMHFAYSGFGNSQIKPGLRGRSRLVSRWLVTLLPILY